MKVMIWSAARGGMRSVVEAYRDDGFLGREDVRLIHSYADGGFLLRQVILLRALVQYLWVLATNRVELVHVHAAMRGSFWRKNIFSSLARRFGVPVLLHLHGSEMKMFYAAQKPFVQKLIVRHLERADRVLVLSDSWREFVAAIAPRAKIVVLPNYVRVADLPDADLRTARNVLFLGLIGPRKGTFDLIDAFSSVADRYPEARLVIGGNGQVEEARAQIERLGMSGRIELAGWVDGDLKARLLAASGIYALPSYNEGLPVSVLEAMAAGLAVVTTRVGGIPELIEDDVHGLLIDAGDVKGLARSLERLLEDDVLRDRLAHAGRLRVETAYSDRVVLPKLHALYAEVARRPNA